ncbi:MAG TPA: cytidylate kinase-like family protein [Gaiellaceae bacterium]|nr:cytidylate kinase-like family protein [Gaiellaceae bacterium]
MSRSVVCISRAWGAGGEEVGRLVAYRLGFFFVDEQIITRAAELGGIDPEAVVEEERRKPLFAGLLDYLTEGGAALALAPVPPVWDEPPSDAVRSFIREAVREVAERGKAVIVAHAASHAVGPGADVLRVLITASPETRAQRLADTEDDPVKTIKQSDVARADYLKRFYGVREELPTHYDLVINTDTLSVDEAVALIVQAASDEAPAS